MNKALTALLALLLTIGGLTSANAAGKPEDVIKYRDSIMDALSNHVSAVLAIATNKIDGQEYLQGHADAIADLSSQLDILFPEGTGGGDSEALPNIWTETEKFAAAIKTMQDAASGLQDAASSGQPVMPAFAGVGKACKGCHESFRAEDD